MAGPLGIPPGSVRALMSLFVVFVTCWLMVRGEEVPLAVSEALFTVLAYYFATRAHVKLMEAAQARESEGENGEVSLPPSESASPNPLYLPSGSIRVVIITAFIGVAIYLGRTGGASGLLSATTLLLVFAFFAGQVVKWVMKWRRAGKPQRPVGMFEHVKAGVGVAVGLAFVALYITGYHKEAPPQAHKFFLGFIIFYFGSR